MDIASLRNKGLLLLNDDPAPVTQATLIVLGIARSGTTMVAGALHKMGVPVCAKENVVFEDVPLSEAVEKKDDAALQRLIAERNAKHAVWGWKRPSLIQNMERVQPQLRAPRYVVIFRDIFAIANRNRLSVYSDIMANMEESLKRYGQLLDFVKGCQRPMLLVSYEKAMVDVGGFVPLLAEFAGVRDKAAIASARQFVRPDPEEYLKGARVVRVSGALERVYPNSVAGWAFHRQKPEPATVVISINGREAARVVAELPRADLKDGKAHPTGRCGFDWQPPAPLKLGDSVSACVAGEHHDLNRSPRPVQRGGHGHAHGHHKK